MQKYYLFIITLALSDCSFGYSQKNMLNSKTQVNNLNKASEQLIQNRNLKNKRKTLKNEKSSTASNKLRVTKNYYGKKNRISLKSPKTIQKLGKLEEEYEDYNEENDLEILNQNLSSSSKNNKERKSANKKNKIIDFESLEDWESYEKCSNNIKSEITRDYFSKEAWNNLSASQRNDIRENEDELFIKNNVINPKNNVINPKKKKYKLRVYNASKYKKTLHVQDLQDLEEIQDPDPSTLVMSNANNNEENIITNFNGNGKEIEFAKLPYHIKPQITKDHFVRERCENLDHLQRNEIGENGIEIQRICGLKPLTFFKSLGIFFFLASMGVEIWAAKEVTDKNNIYYYPNENHDIKYETLKLCRKDYSFCVEDWKDGGLSLIVIILNTIFLLIMLFLLWKCFEIKSKFTQKVCCCKRSFTNILCRIMGCSKCKGRYITNPSEVKK